MKKQACMILFWGALWGIAESTLGYVLHIFSIALPGLPGLLMFPIAFIFMHQVYESTRNPVSIIQTAVIAALIKLTDLFFGGLIPIYVINPALSLLMEGFAVALVFQYISKKQHIVQLGHCISMGLIWRSIFLGYMLVLSRLNLPAGLVTSGWTVALRFLVFESFMNALLINGYLLLTIKRKIEPSATLAWGMMVMAVLLQRVF